MDIRKELLKEHSRAQSDRITRWIGAHPERFAMLMELFMEDEYRVVQRAAWVVSLVAEQQSRLLVPYLDRMVARMETPGVPIAVRRNVVRLLQHITVPPALQGAVMNSCFAFLADSQETVAVRCFSMTVLANLAREYPDITPEISLIIYDQLEHSPTAGFRSRARKVLQQLEKIRQQ